MDKKRCDLILVRYYPIMENPLVTLNHERSLARSQGDELADRCFLATIRADGEPAVRTLVLREVNNQLGIFLNSTSPKYSQLHNSDTVELVVYLPTLQIQYRLRARIQQIPTTIVRRQWKNKKTIPRVVDHLYSEVEQSSKIASRDWLVTLVQSQVAPMEAPETAIGFYLIIFEVERLVLLTEEGVHQRVKSLRTEDGWSSTTLMP